MIMAPPGRATSDEERLGVHGSTSVAQAALTPCGRCWQPIEWVESDSSWSHVEEFLNEHHRVV
jgi:hypothetical protein